MKFRDLIPVQLNPDALILRKIKHGSFRRLGRSFERKSRIMVGHQEISIKRPSIMVFVDDETLVN